MHKNTYGRSENLLDFGAHDTYFLVLSKVSFILHSYEKPMKQLGKNINDKTISFYIMKQKISKKAENGYTTDTKLLPKIMDTPYKLLISAKAMHINSHSKV